MNVKIGTFNLNNLFSRFNFKANIEKLEEADINGTITYSFSDPEKYWINIYKGKLVKPKKDTLREMIVKRIKSIEVDVLAVQEVEDIDTLCRFASEDLEGMYRYKILIEGNDPRLIDVGLLSKYPIGAIISWKEAVHPDNPEKPVFSRDLLEVEVFNKSRSTKLFTIYNTHLKSNFVEYYQDKEKVTRESNLRRKQQAEMIAKIIKSRMRPDSPYIVTGDMNDLPDSSRLEPFVKDRELNLHNALQQPRETRPSKKDEPPPKTSAWTHRFKESGEPAKYELYDQIWLSPSLTDKQQEAWIDRRTKHEGDGSDHDPAWVVLDI
jgi:endonuclease/exonuclease/phosphatase family metal-dependent hydrolase